MYPIKKRKRKNSLTIKTTKEIFQPYLELLCYILNYLAQKYLPEKERQFLLNFSAIKAESYYIMANNSVRKKCCILRLVQKLFQTPMFDCPCNKIILQLIIFPFTNFQTKTIHIKKNEIVPLVIEINKLFDEKKCKKDLINNYFSFIYETNVKRKLYQDYLWLPNTGYNILHNNYRLSENDYNVLISEIEKYNNNESTRDYRSFDPLGILFLICFHSKSQNDGILLENDYRVLNTLFLVSNYK